MNYNAQPLEIKEIGFQNSNDHVKLLSKYAERRF